MSYQTIRTVFDRHAVLAAVVATLLGASPLAVVADEAGKRVEIRWPAQSLDKALDTLAQQAGVRLLYSPEAVMGLRAPAVVGQLEVRQILEKLLAGSGLDWSFTNGAYAIRPADSSASARVLPMVTVSATRTDFPQTGVAGGQALAVARTRSDDSAALLDGLPGVAVATNGGLSGLPVLRGLEDERVKILVDGMSLTAACSNHMNPSLSYITPNRVESVLVMPGVTPVSWGGDNIAGTIAVQSKAPVFARTGEGLHSEGSLSAFYRSNNRSVGGAAFVSAANENLSFSYSGAWDKAEDYRDGNGNKLPLTLYKTRNQVATVAMRGDGNLFTLQVGEQRIPYQGFINANMDMVRNDASFFNLGYEGEFAWGSLKARLYHQNTEHEMDNLPERGGHMPMLTRGKDSGYEIKAEIPLSERDTLRVGNDFHRQTLNDWWPGSTPWYTLDQDAVIINDGRRDRIGVFAEWEAKWDSRWKSLIGLRSDTVRMNSGAVQGYWAVWDKAQADAFNAQSHKRQDDNIDFSAQLEYRPDALSSYEFGFARKTRSPSLYERYFWYGPTNMAGWFGDNNNYNGNINLRPEVAHSVSLSADWHDASGGRDWQFRVTPHYSRIHDYIGVDLQGYNVAGLAQLQFANRQAEIYGVDVAGKALLWDSTAYGRTEFNGGLGWLHGRYVDEQGGKLYHIMPLNARFGLNHRLGGWSNGAEWLLVARKNEIDEARKEPVTPAYALVNLRTAYDWKNLRVDFSITNLFDKQYYLPLGGVNVPQFWAGAHFPVFPAFSPVAGQGRSYNLGLTIRF